MFKRGCLVLLLMSASACGNSPTAPSPASVAGNWSGTWQATQASGGFILAPGFELSPTNSSVAGTWSTSQGNGTASGTTTSTNFSGTFTWNSRSPSGGACTGDLAVSGTAGATTLNWTSPTVTGNCT